MSEQLVDRISFKFGKAARSVQVYAAQGNVPGEDWWVVILELPQDDSYPQQVRTFLTNAPGINLSSTPEEVTGTWIPIKNNESWESVTWDTPRLAKAKSALARAQECFKG